MLAHDGRQKINPKKVEKLNQSKLKLMSPEFLKKFGFLNFLAKGDFSLEGIRPCLVKIFKT